MRSIPDITITCWLLQAVLPNQMHAQLAELTGLKGSVGKRCIVMGLISTQEDGGLALEDEGAVVPVDLTHAAVHAGIVTGEFELQDMWVKG